MRKPFYCEYHGRLESARDDGFNVYHDKEYCDAGLEEVEGEAVVRAELQAEINAENEEIEDPTAGGWLSWMDKYKGAA